MANHVGCQKPARLDKAARRYVEGKCLREIGEELGVTAQAVELLLLRHRPDLIMQRRAARAAKGEA